MIIPRAEHPISRAQISENALKVLNRLREAGFASLLVGGCVRDLMLGREPKDFDVVTNAHPEEIKEIFRNARLIGRRFRLAHVHFGRDVIEVATFRGRPDELEGESDDKLSRAQRDNIFGTQEEDALRRDFTINSLYYNIRDFTVMDYVGGVEDLKRGVLRMIGDPEVRYHEDPVRMLRVVRFAAKLGFKIEETTAAPLRQLGHLLLSVPAARMFEEILKLFHGGHAQATYELLRHYGLFEFLFPQTDACLKQETDGFPATLLPQALANTDARVVENKPVNPAFLFAALLWEPARRSAQRYLEQGMSPFESWQHAGEHVLREQQRHTSVPKRFGTPMREIWAMQLKLERRQGKSAFRMLEHKRFRAAYDFLLLRAQTGEPVEELSVWWTRFQDANPSERAEMVRALGGAESRTRRRRRRKRRSSDHA